MIDDNGIVIAFWILAASTIGCALMVAAVRDLIHSVLFLALTFVGVAGIYICLTFMIETGFGLAERRSMFRRAN